MLRSLNFTTCTGTKTLVPSQINISKVVKYALIKFKQRQGKARTVLLSIVRAKFSVSFSSRYTAFPAPKIKHYTSITKESLAIF